MRKNAIIKEFCSRHFLPIGTLFIIPLGIICPSPGVFLNETLPVVQICIVTLFFVIGIKFRVTEVQSALRRYKEIALGLTIVLLFTPIVGVKLLLLPKFRGVSEAYQQWNGSWNNSLSDSWSFPDFGPEEFRIGLQIFCMSPSASAFATVVVTSSNGDRALTLLIAVMATIVSVFTIPLMITWLIPGLKVGSVKSEALLLRVILFILLPLIIGRLLRFITTVKQVVVKLNKSLKFVTSGSLLLMFWVKISMATAKGHLETFSPYTIVAVTSLGVAVISSFLLLTFIFASIICLSEKSRLAITVLSSAKHSSITLAVIENMPDNIGNKDLMFFPIVFVYLTMVIIINIYAAFMTIKQEKNDQETNELETLNQNYQVINGNREIVLLLEQVPWSQRV